jgi:hypothetical protein
MNELIFLVCDTFNKKKKMFTTLIALNNIHRINSYLFTVVS